MKNNTVLYLTKGNKNNSALLKRRAIADYFGEAEIKYTDKGKPYISSHDGFGISVSHSGNIIGVIISDGEIGLDIQKRGQRDNSRLFSFFPESEKDGDFYSLWTKKESYGKLTGEGVFVQKGKKLPEDVIFTDISNAVSLFAGENFSCNIASREAIAVTIKEIII